MPPLPRSWPALDLTGRPGVQVPAGLSDVVACALDDLGVTAVEEDTARGWWRAYFGDETARAEALPQVHDRLGHLLDIAAVDVEDEGWIYKVQRTLGAVRIGRIIVAPPWDVPGGGAPSAGPGGEPRPRAATGNEGGAADTAAGQDLVIVIEPSTGFGTGHHQSTRLCLAALQRLPVAGARVLDVGTGSGVLALAAAALGARAVLAVDVDPESIRAAAENVTRAGRPTAVDLRCLDVRALPLDPADLVLANLTAWILRRHAGQLGALVTRAGLLVVSGFTTDQEAMVLEAFPDFVLAARDQEDDWVGLTLRHGTGYPEGAPYSQT
jgi:ribosomal protein L11 methyltransferase